MKPSYWSALISACAMHAARAVDPQQIVAYFQQNLSAGSEVVVPGQGNWTADFTQRWNGLYEPSYVVAVKPALEADIQEIVSKPEQRIRRCLPRVIAFVCMPRV